MDGSVKIGETLLYFIPAIIVAGAIYLLIKKYLDNDYKVRLLELKRAIHKETIPLRFQAYERICLFLERISPNNLMVRVNRPGMSARELQSELLQTIRAEYEHNITQQVYVSSQAWDLVKNAREELIRIINTAAATIGENAGGIELSKAVFEIILKNEKLPTQRALDFIKNESRQLL